MCTSLVHLQWTVLRGESMLKGKELWRYTSALLRWAFPLSEPLLLKWSTLRQVSCFFCCFFSLLFLTQEQTIIPLNDKSCSNVDSHSYLSRRRLTTCCTNRKPSGWWSIVDGGCGCGTGVTSTRQAGHGVLYPRLLFRKSGRRELL